MSEFYFIIGNYDSRGKLKATMPIPEELKRQDHFLEITGRSGSLDLT